MIDGELLGKLGWVPRSNLCVDFRFVLEESFAVGEGNTWRELCMESTHWMMAIILRCRHSCEARAYFYEMARM